MPADLIIVALVYVDMLVDRDQARGVLTVQSWRPLLVGCLLLASKVYEDWCICNFEAAQFSGFTDASMLRLELLVMDTLNWNVNISAETFAPYFWAVERVISEGRDDMDSSFSVTLTAAEREQLEERVGLSPLNLCSTPTHNRSIQSVTLASASLSMSLCSDPGCDSPHSSSSTISLPVGGGMRCVNGFSFNDFRLQVDTLDEATRASFVFVDRFESRYKLHEALGHGTFGVVHRITRRGEPDKMLAVKLFTSKGLSEGAVSSAARKTTALVQSFFLSGVAASMKHPNIVRFVEIVIDESRSTPLASIVPIMEVLHGPDLFDWLATRQNEVELGQREWISERAVAAIMKQVLSGLQYLHGNTPSVVHRDVKAENLRWASNAPNALLKLVDFGLVYVDGYEDPMDGEVVGTPSYSAPEMLNTVNARRPNAALDMYAAGVVLFLLLSARFPFTETADRTVLPDMVSGAWAHVSQCVLILLRQLLNAHPDGRPSSEEALRSSWFTEAEYSHKSAVSPVHPLPTPTSSVLSLRPRSSLSSAAVASNSTP
jgi:serine/threonine protein kinase